MGGPEHKQSSAMNWSKRRGEVLLRARRRRRQQELQPEETWTRWWCIRNARNSNMKKSLTTIIATLSLCRNDEEG